jgi:hypothetical protein
MSTTRTFEKFHNHTELVNLIVYKKSFKVPLTYKNETFPIKYNIEILDEIKEPESVIFINISFDIMDGSDLVLFEAGYVYEFKVKEIDDFLETIETGRKIKKEYAEWLDNIAIATSRGAIYEDLRGTFLDSSLLPLIDPHNWKH